MAIAGATCHTSPSPLPAPVGARAWACDLFATARFVDKRLDRRAREVLSALAAKPADSIPQAFDDWAGAKATYRFIENDRVRCEDILAPLGEAAGRACASHRVVLAVQDTTALTFPKARSMQGLGDLNDFSKGLLFHTTLALTPEATPLGVLDLQWWSRDGAERGKAGLRKKRSVEEKESAKWLRGIRAASRAWRAQRGPLDTGRLIHVFDREGDVHEVFEEIGSGGDQGAVIRCAQNRRARRHAGDPIGWAHQIVRGAPLLGVTTIDLPRAHGMPARPDVAVQLRACTVTLCPSPTQHPRRRDLGMTLVELWESDPPKGVEALHWLLWTTEPADTLQEALAIVGIYRLRWRIEDYHLVLKAGCRVEDLQFESAERAAKVIYLYAAVAVRILALRELSRREPEAPCTRVLSHAEWRTLWTYIHKKPPARHAPPPTIKQAVLWIGRLGGHLGRKSDGMPGVTTLWRGWRDLSNLLVLYCALSP